MILLLALLIPFAVGLVGYLLGQKHITAREFALQEAILFVIISVMYFVMLSGKTNDVEILSSSIAEKHKGREGCCHSYPCRCRQECIGSGKSQSCSEVCDTCYLHSYDVYWSASNQLGSTMFYDGCNSPGSSSPRRWDEIYIGEPTAQSHSFTNYIKGNPNSILRRDAVSPNLLAQVPEYPTIYDLYRSQRFMSLGVRGVNIEQLNHELSYINAQLGSKKRVNVIVMVTSEGDITFGEAVRQKWLGGKKNDVIVIIGTPAFPEISWVDVVSWTQSEQMKINIRDSILGLKTWDGEKVLGIVAFEVDRDFVHRHMADFKYLQAGVEPSKMETTVLFIMAFVLSLVFSIAAWKVDFFDEEVKLNRRRL